MFTGQTVLVVKAPPETKLEVPDPSLIVVSGHVCAFCHFFSQLVHCPALFSNNGLCHKYIPHVYKDHLPFGIHHCSLGHLIDPHIHTCIVTTCLQSLQSFGPLSGPYMQFQYPTQC